MNCLTHSKLTYEIFFTASFKGSNSSLLPLGNIQPLLLFCDEQ